jgi:hypothetical protein
MIILPRQARDKHRENTQKRKPFCLKQRRFSPDRKKRILKNFTAKNQSSTYFDERAILSYLPVGLSRCADERVFRATFLRL